MDGSTPECYGVFSNRAETMMDCKGVKGPAIPDGMDVFDEILLGGERHS